MEHLTNSGQQHGVPHRADGASEEIAVLFERIDWS